MAASLCGLGLLWGGSEALGQAAPRTPGPREHRAANSAIAVATPAGAAESPAPPLAGPAPPVERIRPVAAVEAEPPAIQLTAMQQRPVEGGDARGQDYSSFDVLVEPPGPMRLFTLDSEAALKERMRQEARERPDAARIEFPDVPVLSTEVYVPGRRWEPICRLVEPNYVCHDKLLFEEKNSERFGWDLGFVQPFVSAGAFYWDVFFLPYHCATAPGRPECSAGYRLPGDPIPYLLYPPELSVTGMWGQSTAMLLVYRFFPGQTAFPPNLPVSNSPAPPVTPPPGGPPGGLPGGFPSFGQ